MTPDLNLNEADLKSLRFCPHSRDHYPKPGNRTGYVKQILVDEELVRGYWFKDEENGECIHTWQRTPRGDDALIAYDYKPSEDGDTRA